MVTIGYSAFVERCETDFAGTLRHEIFVCSSTTREKKHTIAA